MGPRGEKARGRGSCAEGVSPAGRVEVEGTGCRMRNVSSGLFSRWRPEGRKPDEVPPPESL